MAEEKARRKKEVRAKQWEQQVHQNLVSWGRSILIKAVDIALHVWPPPAGLMDLFIKHNREKAKKRKAPPLSEAKARPRLGVLARGDLGRSAGAAPRRRLWQPGDQPEEPDAEEEEEQRQDVAEACMPDGLNTDDEDLENHDPCDSDFAPAGDSHNIDGYKVLSKKDDFAPGGKRMFLQDKDGVVTESIGIDSKEQEDADQRQTDVENAMDQPNADDVQFIAPSEDDDSDGLYPSDDGGPDSPIRKPKKKKSKPKPKQKPKTKKKKDAKDDGEEDLYAAPDVVVVKGADAADDDGEQEVKEMLPPATAPPPPNKIISGPNQSARIASAPEVAEAKLGEIEAGFPASAPAAVPLRKPPQPGALRVLLPPPARPAADFLRQSEPNPDHSGSPGARVGEKRREPGSDGSRDDAAASAATKRRRIRIEEDEDPPPPPN